MIWLKNEQALELERAGFESPLFRLKMEELRWQWGFEDSASSLGRAESGFWVARKIKKTSWKMLALGEAGGRVGTIFASSL